MLAMHKSLLATLLVLVGCASETTDPGSSEQPEPVEAPVSTRPTTQSVEPVALVQVGTQTVVVDRQRYLEFLQATRGLDAILNLMQLELAREQVRQIGLDPDAVDVEAEVRRTLNAGFRGPNNEQLEVGDYEQALQRILNEQGLSRAEFDVVMETNALLRAAAEPNLRDRLTDEVLQREFNRRYGQQAQVRVISLPNLQDVQAAKRRLDSGEAFGDLAAELNEDPSLATRRGLIEPFTREAALPPAIKTAAFNLQPGEVSDPVASEGQFLLLKLETFMEPQAVTFEDVKEPLREELVQQYGGQIVEQYRQVLAAILSSDALEIEDEALARQFRERLEAARPQPVDEETLKRQMEAERPTTLPTTQPN
jgi:parvulin-like peptidyl-prolyl isomerase